MNETGDNGYKEEAWTSGDQITGAFLDWESGWWWKVRERKSFGLTPRSVLPTGLPFTELGAWEEGPVWGTKKLNLNCWHSPVEAT